MARWKQSTAERVRMKSIVFNVTSRWVNRTAAIAMERWKHVAFEQRRMKTVARKVTARWLNQVQLPYMHAMCCPVLTWRILLPA
eukprot:1302513-Rhodomonas_salina.1